MKVGIWCCERGSFSPNCRKAFRRVKWSEAAEGKCLENEDVEGRCECVRLRLWCDAKAGCVLSSITVLGVAAE